VHTCTRADSNLNIFLSPFCFEFCPRRLTQSFYDSLKFSTIFLCVKQCTLSVLYGPNYFYDDICDAEETLRSLYTITNIRWFKQGAATNKAEHEFLVAEVTRRDGLGYRERVYLVVERSPSSDAGFKSVVKSSVKTSHPVSVMDEMHCIDDQAYTTLLTDRCCQEPLGSYPFSAFPILEFLRMVHLVSHMSGVYYIIMRERALCKVIGIDAQTHHGAGTCIYACLKAGTPPQCSLRRCVV
jgi:hypothetical protein